MNKEWLFQYKYDEINKLIKFDAVLIGDDRIPNEGWIKTAEDLKKIGIDVVFLPHTDGISTSILRNKLNK